ncbi:MAG TPA: ferritin-like domain-containing protein [Gaiellaceae bacterium]|nr:ferritin-like domain-containing protein [Gaiellaceae bacterium]
MGSRAASREEILAKGGLVLAGLAAGAAWLGGRASPAASAPSPEQDERILNFALGLEELQAAFYAQALEEGGLTGEALELAEVVGAQERRHVAYLREYLGPAARPEPELDLSGAAGSEETFLRSAHALEEAGVGAYIGQGGNLTVRAVAAAAPIVSVEARHAAWIRDMLGMNPAPEAADPARTPEQVRASLERAGLPFPG